MAAPGLTALGGYGSGSSSDESDTEVETPKVAPEEKLLHLKVNLQTHQVHDTYIYMLGINRSSLKNVIGARPYKCVLFSCFKIYFIILCVQE